MTENVLNQFITKIEGHGRLKYDLKKSCVRIEIDEGERLFEKLVVGQSYKDIAFITARICGVCPTAHTLAATKAIENAFEVSLNDKVTDLRYALELAQIIQSHALHLFFLAIPDYLGVKSALELKEKDPRSFKIAIELKDLGDELVRVIGGRAVHPVTPTIGGFTQFPEDDDVKKLITKVRSAQKIGLETLEIFAKFKYPYLKRQAEYFALFENGKPDVLGTDLVSSEGVKTEASSYQYVIKEVVKNTCTAKYALHDGHGFLVGAMARLNQTDVADLNPKTQKALELFKIKLPFDNSFKINLAQAIEILNSLEEIEKRLTAFLWSKKGRARVPYTVKAGVGVGVVEAPRGLLFHMYEIDENGIVINCDIITPTVQNLTNLEDDANEYLKQNKALTIPRREKELEMLIRAYDPCITCSVH